MSTPLDTHHQTLRAVPLTERYRRACYDLIQEQAEQHASATADHQADEENSQRLFDTITREHGSKCLLVVNEEGRALAAATYYECHTELGAGYYLEDIITTKSVRNQGHGTFALAALAQMTLHEQFNYVALECAFNNEDGQHFYTHRGAERLEDRHTWRLTTPLVPRSTSDEACTYRRVTSDDVPMLLAFIEANDSNCDVALVENWLDTQTRNHNPNLTLAIGTNAESGDAEVQGFAFAYRNFSTFRTVSGLHIEGMTVKDNNPDVAAGMIEYLAKVQRQKGWTGHIDFTVKDHQRDLLEPVLDSFGFTSLAYGGDKMVVRRFQQASLETLANRYNGRNLIGELVSSEQPNASQTTRRSAPTPALTFA